MNPKAEQIRKRYPYRHLVLSGNARISQEMARRMVGPDCAYHSYGPTQSPKTRKENQGRVNSKQLAGKHIENPEWKIVNLK